ncbi:hypothetical protein MRB53_039940 [Persea americana]|nr:hypothetical protein MRB53_039940 [Persea americana]
MMKGRKDVLAFARLARPVGCATRGLAAGWTPKRTGGAGPVFWGMRGAMGVEGPKTPPVCCGGSEGAGCRAGLAGGKVLRPVGWGRVVYDRVEGVGWKGGRGGVGEGGGGRVLPVEELLLIGGLDSEAELLGLLLAELRLGLETRRLGLQHRVLLLLLLLLVELGQTLTLRRHLSAAHTSAEVGNRGQRSRGGGGGIFNMPLPACCGGATGRWRGMAVSCGCNGAKPVC